VCGINKRVVCEDLITNPDACQPGIFLVGFEGLIELLTDIFEASVIAKVNLKYELLVDFFTVDLAWSPCLISQLSSRNCRPLVLCQAGTFTIHKRNP
jgi:hypothetical protein